MRILIAIKGFLGDTILSTPLFAAIKKLHPESEIYVIARAQAASLLRREPLLNGIIIYDRGNGLLGLLRQSKQLRNYGFNRVYSIHRSARTALMLYMAGIPERVGFADANLSILYNTKIKRDLEQHEVLRNLAITSSETPIQLLSTELRLHVPEIKDVATDLRQTIHKRRYAVLVPGSVWATKRWHWQGYRQVAACLIKNGWQVVLTGSPQEAEISAQVASGLELVDYTGKISIEESLLLLKHSQLVVCNDSMALHASSAFKIPTVAVFCATSQRFGFGPWKNRAIVVEKEGLSCKPCARHGGRKCPNGTEACMRNLDASRVIRSIEEVLEEELVQ